MLTLIKNSLANLKGHKLRVAVALLWIIIGITSVIVVSSIGNGLEAEVKKSIDKVSANKTRIDFETNDYGAFDVSVFLKPFTQQDIETLSFLEGVDRIGPSKDGFDMGSTFSTDITFDKKNSSIEVSPVKKDSTVKAMMGRDFTLDDDNRNVVMLTMQNATDLFENPEDAIGNGVTISGGIYQVIGIVDDSSVLEEEQQNGMFGGGYSGWVTAYMPQKSFDNLMNQFSYPTEIYSLDLVVSKGYDVSEVAYRVIDKLHELHPDIEGSYTTPDPSQQDSELQYMTDNINKFVTIITFVAMFVGGIGVMNIMYVSVMERQREIGIRRAIGAKPIAILFQFLVEATFITVCGGILGMFVGAFATDYVSNYIGFKAIPSLNSFMYAILATISTGIIFGIIPAYKASKLDPIKAIYK